MKKFNPNDLIIATAKSYYKGRLDFIYQVKFKRRIFNVLKYVLKIVGIFNICVISIFLIVLLSKKYYLYQAQQKEQKLLEQKRLESELYQKRIEKEKELEKERREREEQKEKERLRIINLNNEGSKNPYEYWCENILPKMMQEKLPKGTYVKNKITKEAGKVVRYSSEGEDDEDDILVFTDTNFIIRYYNEYGKDNVWFQCSYKEYRNYIRSINK